MKTMFILTTLLISASILGVTAIVTLILRFLSPRLYYPWENQIDTLLKLIMVESVWCVILAFGWIIQMVF